MNDYEIVAAYLFEGKDRKVSDRIITYGLFIDPPLGRAGMTLAQAEASGKNFKVGYSKMEDVAQVHPTVSELIPTMLESLKTSN